MVTILLPNKSASQSLFFATLPHPQDRLPTKFVLRCDTPVETDSEFLPALVNPSLYELLAVNGEQQHTFQSHEVISQRNAHSLLLSSSSNDKDGQVISDATVYIATEFNPLFLVIYKLWDAKERFISAEDIFDSIDDDHQQWACDPLRSVALESEIAEKLKEICDLQTISNLPDYYRLSTAKLTQFLDKTCRAVVDSLPETLLRERVIQPLAPSNILEEIPEAILVQAKRSLAMSLVASYLPESVSTFYESQYDLSELRQYEEKQKKERAAALLQQQQMQEMAAKRPVQSAGASVGKQKKAAVKPQPSGPGIMSFFGKKAKS